VKRVGKIISDMAEESTVEGRLGARAARLVGEGQRSSAIGEALLHLLTDEGWCLFRHDHGEVATWIVEASNEWRLLMPEREPPDDTALRSWLLRIGVVDVIRAMAITAASASRRDDIRADRYWWGVCSGIERER
jgi:hypothetical protein